MSVKNDKIAKYTSQHWYDMDEGPKGRFKRLIHKKARAQYKQELKDELEVALDDRTYCGGVIPCPCSWCTYVDLEGLVEE